MISRYNRLVQNHFVKATKRSFFTLRSPTFHKAATFNNTSNLRYFSATPPQSGGDGDNKPTEEENKAEEETK